MRAKAVNCPGWGREALRRAGLITLLSNTLVVDRWDELTEAGEFDSTYLRPEKRGAG
jgi:hypothetical protein